VRIHARERQTDRQSECAAECRSERQGRCSHRNTVCLVVMVQSNTAHFFSLREPEYFGDILGLCLCASALGMHMHILHVSVAAGKYRSAHEDRKYLSKWHGTV